VRGVITALAFIVATASMAAQAPQGGRAGGAAPGGRAGGPPPSARTTAPIDLTGNWVAVISEDWRWRMVTPAKGDVQSIPVTQKALDAANAWDPQRDTAAGEQCRAYGAPGLMRAPTRLRISWQDDQTLKVETDYGMQTRLLYFAPGRPPTGPPSWQGSSVARWENAPRGRGAGPAAGGQGPPPSGNLRVVTTNLRPGYLRKNGVPYSANTVYTEYWNLFRTPTHEFLVITSVVRDPENLQIDWLTSLNFQREADGSKWDPTPCNASW
jgi:hypothetical protein